MSDEIIAIEKHIKKIGDPRDDQWGFKYLVFMFSKSDGICIEPIIDIPFNERMPWGWEMPDLKLNKLPKINEEILVVNGDETGNWRTGAVCKDKNYHIVFTNVSIVTNESVYNFGDQPVSVSNMKLAYCREIWEEL